MARTRKAPTVARYPDVKGVTRTRPFYVYAYVEGTRRVFTFPERDEAEAFAALVLSRGADYAAGRYDRRRATEGRLMRSNEPTTLAALAAKFAAERPKPATQKSYGIQAAYLAEFLPTATLDVSALKPKHLEGYAEFLRTRPNGRGGTMAANTVRMAWVTARAVLDRAVRQGLAEVNVARMVEDAPKAARKGTTDSTARAIERHEFEAIADHLAPEPRALAELLWHSGLRVGEALALTWGDVSGIIRGEVKGRMVEGVEVFVHRSLTLRAADAEPKPGESKRWVVGTTKSGRARRVGIDVEAFEGLGLTRGRATDRLFTAHREHYSWAWRRARAAAAAEGHDVATVRLHDLRHSRVTHLLREGADADAVSRAMGHSSMAFTVDRYGHAMPTESLRLLA